MWGGGRISFSSTSNEAVFFFFFFLRSRAITITVIAKPSSSSMYNTLTTLLYTYTAWYSSISILYSLLLLLVRHQYLSRSLLLLIVKKRFLFTFPYCLFFFLLVVALSGLHHTDDGSLTVWDGKGPLWKAVAAVFCLWLYQGSEEGVRVVSERARIARASKQQQKKGCAVKEGRSTQDVLLVEMAGRPFSSLSYYYCVFLLAHTKQKLEGGLREEMN